MRLRTKTSRPSRTALCLLLALSLVGPMTPIPAAAGPADWALDKIFGIAFSLAEGAAFKALGAAVDPNSAEELEKVLDCVDGLLGGTNSIEHECEKILQAVNDLSKQMSDLENRNDQQFNDLKQTVTLNEIERQREQIVKMSDSVYAPALTAYNDFIKAAQDYSASIGTTNESARLESAKQAERALAAAFDKLDYEGDLTTLETHGINMGHYTNHRYLYNLDKYADEALAFDHQRYALLTAGINDVVVNLNVIVYAQRLEYDYWSAKAGNDPDNDAWRDKVSDLERALITNIKRVTADINFTVAEFANKDGDAAWPRTDLLTLMRPYDFQTEYDFNYESSSSRTFEYRTPDPNGQATSTVHYTATAVKTAPTMPVYRASVKGATYLMVDGSRGVSHGEKQGDLIHGLRYWEKLRSNTLSTYDCFGLPDQDFYNLLSTRDGVYSLPQDFAALAPLVEQESYANSEGSLTSFLGSNGMASIDQESYVLMNSYVDPAPLSNTQEQNHSSSFNLFSTAIPTSGDYESAKTSLTMDDTADDPGMLVVLAQETGKREAYQLHVNAEGSGLDIVMTDLTGNALPDKVPAGTCVKLSVVAPEPSMLDSLVLKNANGDVLEKLATPEAASLVEPDQPADPDRPGAMSFMFAMPFQDAFVVATSSVAPANPLNFSEDADGAYLVSTLDDLVKVAAAYEQHAEAYENATFRLAADIVNPSAPFPAWTTPIGTEAHPFTGTFDGAGHRISGFTMDMTKDSLAAQRYGGIFGVIGEGGVVRDVAVSAVDFSGDPASQSVGALAGLNRGSIVDCSTGSAQAGATVEGLDAGGLVAVNSGQVLNCWSGADVRASANGGHGGGLVGVAEAGSSVWSSYALGNVYAGEQVGGLIGSNSGDVYNAYFAGAEVSGAQAGSFIGANHHDVFAAYAVEGVAGSAFGSGDAGDDPEAGLAEMKRDSMTAQSFANQLNAKATGAMNWWTWSRDANAGLPSQVKDPMIERTITDGATGVSLTGTIHAGAVLSVEPITEGDASYDALLQHAEASDLLGEMTAAYRPLLPVNGRKSGQAALGGGVTLRIPVAAAFAGRDVTVLQELPDGMVALDAAVADGVATVQVSAVTPFAVIVADVENPPVDPPDEPDEPDTPVVKPEEKPAAPVAKPAMPGGSATALAPMGDGAGGWAGALGALLAAAAGAAVVSYRRNRKHLR
ncbi:hypothetical protein [Arabiibacter massiliensis]|uniref:hypothetical protein n=1 Tax=Arabiibacter massiliensis TaxID=1870985 RepID=UPI0009BAD5DB|nr:hypothetical protein [Arabiibacter massiliensis]